MTVERHGKKSQPARFRPLTPAEAPGKAAELLGDLVRRHGQVGTMVATMAHSPAVLAGYLDLSRATKRARLDRKLSERVSSPCRLGWGVRRAWTATRRPPGALA
jgi:hypothetical protein